MLRIPLPEYADGTLYSVQEHRDNTINTRMRCSGALAGSCWMLVFPAASPWAHLAGC